MPTGQAANHMAERRQLLRSPALMIKVGIRVKEVAINVLCFETLIGIAVCCVLMLLGACQSAGEDN